MFNPCEEHCYFRYGKQYTEDCDTKCDYARVAKENRNEQLTVQELKDMVAEAIWIVESESKTSYWSIIAKVYDDGIELISADNLNDYGSFRLYGDTWVAYRRRKNS